MDVCSLTNRISLIYFYSEWRMVFVVILVGMHQLQSAERLRPRDSEADKIVHVPDATQRRAHLPGSNVQKGDCTSIFR